MTISHHLYCRVIYTSWYHDYQSPLILSYYLHIMLPRLPVTTDTIVLPTNCRLHLTAGAEYTYSYGGATAYDPQYPRRRVVPHSRLTCRLSRVSLASWPPRYA